MQHPAWFVIIAGLLCAALGVIWLLAPSLPWLGKLPGDVHWEGKNVRFHFPIVTCILASLVLTGVMQLIRYFSK